MLTKRIIPCLDVKDGRVVKGVSFKGLRDAGEPLELAKYYNDQGADELVFLDITASNDKRKTTVDLTGKLGKELFIPFTIGGGVSDIDDIKNILMHGADKVAINTAAVLNPNIIDKGADLFGSQCIVIAVDAKREGDSWKVYRNAAKVRTDFDVIGWVKEIESRGGGEILLTSIDNDGQNQGYDLKLLEEVTRVVTIPVIASGGGGELNHFYEALQIGKADAVLAASVFHYGKYTIDDIKSYLEERQIPVRKYERHN